MQEIQVPNANLQCAILDRAILIKANLHGVNLQGACLCNANLSGAVIDNTFFGELVFPFKNIEEITASSPAIIDCCFSTNGKWLTILEPECINIYKTEERERVKSIEISNKIWFGISKFSHDSQFLAAGTKSCNIYI